MKHPKLILLLACLLLSVALPAAETPPDAAIAPIDVPTETTLEPSHTIRELELLAAPVHGHGGRGGVARGLATDVAAVDPRQQVNRAVTVYMHQEGDQVYDLHVPVGQPVRLTLTSEDVIHDFFIPAFRVKQDAVPGRYNVAWFEATKVGTYHIFCAEYCGAEHSLMIGKVIGIGAPSEIMESREVREIYLGIEV